MAHRMNHFSELMTEMRWSDERVSGLLDIPTQQVKRMRTGEDATPARILASLKGMAKIGDKSVRSSKKLSPIYLDAEDSVAVPTVLKRVRSKRIAFGWYGGKFSHLDWLLPLLPMTHNYCEPFSGSGAVLLNRSPSKVETYNDIDGELVNFFKILRDNPEELTRLIALTPFSREEFHKAVTGNSNKLSNLERARRFYIRARQTRTGLAQTATLGRWANCRDSSRSGMAGVVSRWLGGVEALPEIASRLIRVQIENRPAIDVIRAYDSKDTLFYCDPPYLHDTRGDSKAYGFEMDEGEHIDLASTLNACMSKVAISGYRNALMDRLYKNWTRYDAAPRSAHSVKQMRQECLWMNY
jgi:DNA adenine methylase